MTIIQQFTKGIYRENPVFRLVLGLCPTLAVTGTVENGIGMGIAVTAVLMASNLVISLFRSLVPPRIRIPVFIVIIATFVSIVQMFMEAYVPALYEALGIFVPLIVVNCIILGRAEAFASRNNPVIAVVDGLGMGIGFTVSLTLISSIREVLGNGTILNFAVLPAAFQPVKFMGRAPGAFLTMGLLMGLFHWIGMRKKAERA